FSPDGRYLAVATASGRGDVHLWDWRNRTEVARLHHDLPVRAVQFSEDGKKVFSLSGGLVDFDATYHEWTVGLSALLQEACFRLKDTDPKDIMTAMKEAGTTKTLPCLKQW